MRAAALAPVTTRPPRRPVAPCSALDALLSSGAIDPRQHAAAAAYRDLRARFEAGMRAARSTRNGGATVLPEAEWFALKRRHGAVVEAAGFDRFLLDRLCLDGEAPLPCEAARVGEALGRLAHCVLRPDPGTPRV